MDDLCVDPPSNDDRWFGQINDCDDPISFSGIVKADVIGKPVSSVTHVGKLQGTFRASLSAFPTPAHWQAMKKPQAILYG